MYLVLSTLTSSPISLVAATKASAPANVHLSKINTNNQLQIAENTVCCYYADKIVNLI